MVLRNFLSLPLFNELIIFIVVFIITSGTENRDGKQQQLLLPDSVAQKEGLSDVGKEKNSNEFRILPVEVGKDSAKGKEDWHLLSANNVNEKLHDFFYFYWKMKEKETSRRSTMSDGATQEYCFQSPASRFVIPALPAKTESAINSCQGFSTSCIPNTMPVEPACNSVDAADFPETEDPINPTLIERFLLLFFAELMRQVLDPNPVLIVLEWIISIAAVLSAIHWTAEKIFGQRVYIGVLQENSKLPEELARIRLQTREAAPTLTATNHSLAKYQFELSLISDTFLSTQGRRTLRESLISLLGTPPSHVHEAEYAETFSESPQINVMVVDCDNVLISNSDQQHLHFLVEEACDTQLLYFVGSVNACHRVAVLFGISSIYSAENGGPQYFSEDDLSYFCSFISSLSPKATSTLRNKIVGLRSRFSRPVLLLDHIESDTGDLVPTTIAD